MGKRRRERDRPKTGPDAYYNPNKRVLLSYASDDDNDVAQTPDETEPLPLRDGELANYHFDEYPDEEKEKDQDRDVDAGATRARDGHSHERADEEDIDDLNEDESEDVIEKENHYNTHGSHRPNNRSRDISTGQFCSLGGPPDNYDDDDNSYDSTTEEAMAYLHSVRTERSEMPKVLSVLHSTTMGKNPLNEDAAPNTEEFLYEDEAYIGLPQDNTVAEHDPKDPRHVFTQALRARFLSHHQLLHQLPTVESLTALSSAYPISFPQGNNKAYAEWHRLIASKEPRLAQLQSLSQETVSDLLALVQKHFLVSGKNIKKTVSSWLWSLLARSEEVGNMSNDEVYPLRELGKQAILVQLSLTDPAAAQQVEQLGATEIRDEIDLEDDATNPPVPVTKGSMPASFITENTKATLDIILVIIGDVFGQRDLLEFRQAWTVATDGTG